MWRRWWPARPGVFRGLARTRRGRGLHVRACPVRRQGPGLVRRHGPVRRRGVAHRRRGADQAPKCWQNRSPAKLDRLFLLANSEQFGIQEQHFHPTTCPDSVAVWQER